MKKTKLNYLLSFLFFGGLAMTFTQCDKEYVAADMAADHAAAIDVRGNGNNNQGDANNSGDQVNQNLCTCLMDNYAIEELSTVEIWALKFMIEEEKMARDVYDFLFEKWEYRIFDQISDSEQRHMDAIVCLIGKYGILNPITDDAMGVFVNEGLAAFYTTFTEMGSASFEAAFTVGATIEDLDIKDLANWAENENVDNKDIQAVFGELAKGSRNHLRAFVKNLARIDADYTQQYISEEDFLAIINSEREKGSSICEGLNDCVFNNYGPGQGNADGTCDGCSMGRKNNGNNKNNSGQGNKSNNGRNNPGTPSGNCDGTGPNGN